MALAAFDEEIAASDQIDWDGLEQHDPHEADDIKITAATDCIKPN